MGEPPQAHSDEFQRYALIAAFEGGIEVIRECNIKAALMISMGEAPGEVGDSDADLSTGLRNAVKFYNCAQRILKVLQNMVRLNQLKVIIWERVR